MRLYFLSLGIVLFSSITGSSQSVISPEVESRLKSSVSKEAAIFSKRLTDANVDKLIVEFQIDTFKVERYMAECLRIDMSDYGMSNIAYQGAKMYDSLLNKYYKKLSGILQADDRKILVNAQKSWLVFRDGEAKLTELISKDVYSGGGTLQRLEESSRYLDLVKERTLAIFQHLQRATQTF